ncbi:MAG: cysteine protease [Rhodospirillaceae bacterium]|jgi:hypothetical protein|nr:cysteine protease [Rhodospirillaceae bacterium]MBT4939412.1 cysteine protease [Rhodospirillaceae bacterium]MBT5940563.1 cysteine protease [Rhodospirillaceae bacterium]MBT7265788.1 cysteine protease [Rhodospirillaceae bacterium]
MLFTNPAGAPELGCNECGCRWFDRIKNECYECGWEVPKDEIKAFADALEEYYKKTGNPP